MLIKFCGLTRASDAALAEQLGANFLGVIMAGGPRNVSEGQASLVLGPKRHSVRRVAVFGPQTHTEIVAIAERLELDVVQLHNDPTVDDVKWLQARISCAIWPVLRVEGMTIPLTGFDIAGAAGNLLLDAKVVGQLGGTGAKLDWVGLQQSVRELRSSAEGAQMILAGGLKPANVSTACQLLHPDVVDVSSGVETAPGIKDADSMAAFVTAVRTWEHG